MLTAQLATWIFIRKSLELNIPVMLLYVLESIGSSPGRQGFLMAVNSKGEMKGSIGGGIMEHKFVEMAVDSLKKGKIILSVRKQFHNKSAIKDQSGMICSGEQTILLYSIDKKDFNTIQDLIECLEKSKNGLVELSPAGLSFSNQTTSENQFTYRFQSEEKWYYVEKIGPKNRLYIIGGGHCALAFSRIMSMMDFYIHLFDDRSELNTFTANNFVNEKVIVSNYNELDLHIPSGENHYVVIMTFGYMTDDIAVRTLMHKNFKYIGLLGSQKKTEKMFTDYLAEGMDPLLLNRIHAPIGISINSKTPEEIAVSIAAQIIEVKNNK